MNFNLNHLIFAFIILAVPKIDAKPVERDIDYVFARDSSALIESLGIPSPNFADEVAIWKTSFHKRDIKGVDYVVQLPRVYTEGLYDAESSQQHFLEMFSHGQEAWKEGAVATSDESHIQRRFSASLTLKYCNKGHGSGTCTGFSLSYNSGGCQAAPGTNSIVVSYSDNAAVVTWNKGGCQGKHTLFANGCNSGTENVDDETPGTNSFQFIVGCTF